MYPPPVSCGKEQKSYTRFRNGVKVLKIREKLVDKRRAGVIYYPSTTGWDSRFAPEKTLKEIEKVLDKGFLLWYYIQAAAEKAGRRMYLEN